MKETFVFVLRKMSLSDAMEIFDYYGESIYLQGGTEDYAQECVSDLIAKYLDK